MKNYIEYIEYGAIWGAVALVYIATIVGIMAGTRYAFTDCSDYDVETLTYLIKKKECHYHSERCKLQSSEPLVTCRDLKRECMNGDIEVNFLWEGE